MKKHVLKRSLIAAAVLALAGTVAAEGCHIHETTEHAAAQQSGVDDPWLAMHADMMRLQERIERLFNNSFGHVDAVSAPQQAGAEITLQEQGDNYVVEADIPGASEGDIDVNLDGRLLSISSQSQGSDKLTDDDGTALRQESYASSVQQAFTLPGPVDATGMHTRFDDGVLTITIPKATA